MLLVASRINELMKRTWKNTTMDKGMTQHELNVAHLVKYHVGNLGEYVRRGTGEEIRHGLVNPEILAPLPSYIRMKH